MESFYSILDNSHFNPENDKSNDVLEDEFYICELCRDGFEEKLEEGLCKDCIKNGI